jgi:hypothetical protein
LGEHSSNLRDQAASLNVGSTMMRLLQSSNGIESWNRFVPPWSFDYSPLSIEKRYSSFSQQPPATLKSLRPSRLSSAEMKATIRFPEDVLAVLRKAKGLRIRAGSGTHRFVGIWFVMVNDRVFIRSWSVKPNGWYRTFSKDARGTIQTKNGEIAVRAILIQTKRLRDAIDRAYLDAYNTPGALKYAKDLAQPKSRATTIELVPYVSTR